MNSSLARIGDMRESDILAGNMKQFAVCLFCQLSARRGMVKVFINERQARKTK
jgi:hypothetical protein